MGFPSNKIFVDKIIVESEKPALFDKLNGTCVQWVFPRPFIRVIDRRGESLKSVVIDTRANYKPLYEYFRFSL